MDNVWIDGVKKECEVLELRMIPEICGQGKLVFVDINIRIETLRRIASENHTLVMLADPMISCVGFLNVRIRKNQFLYKLIMGIRLVDKYYIAVTTIISYN